MDWIPLAADLIVPALSILVPTGVAIWLARRERQDNRASLQRERLLSAAAPLFVDLAELIHLDPVRQDFRPALSTMRAHIASFRAALDREDSLASDWLGLRHREGMHLLEAAATPIQGPSGMRIAQYDEAGPERVQAWSNTTMQQLQGWISGEVQADWIRSDGARIIAKYGTGRTEGDTPAPVD